MSTPAIHLQHPLGAERRVDAARRELRLALSSAAHAAALVVGVAGLAAVAALPFAATVVLG